MNNLELCGNNEIAIYSKTYEPILFRTEINSISLKEIILPPVPNEGFSTVDIMLDCKITNVNDEVPIQFITSQIFDFKNLKNDQVGQFAIRDAINNSYIDLYNKIYKLNIYGVLFNKLANHIVARFNYVYNVDYDIDYVFEYLSNT